MVQSNPGKAGMIARLTTSLFGALVLFLSVPAAAQQAAVQQELSIENRRLATPIETSSGAPVIRVQQGDTVSLTWTSDEGTELHLEGYDVELALDANNPAHLKFKAAAAGRFALEARGFAGGSSTASQNHAAAIDGGSLTLAQLADAIVGEIAAARAVDQGGDLNAAVTAASDTEVLLLYVEVEPR